MSHIPRATKEDDEAMAPPAVVAPQPYMPEEWPDFSKMQVDPDIENKFFHRKKEYDTIMGHLEDEPLTVLLLLGNQNSGKSVSHRQLSIDNLCYLVFTHFTSRSATLTRHFLKLNHAGIIKFHSKA
jgi:hypothetical protein